MMIIEVQMNTIRIKHGDTFLVIPAHQFDPKIHEEYGVEVKEVEPVKKNKKKNETTGGK